MPRSPMWKEIASALTGEIGAGHYAPGDKLPTEAALAERFGVNRHTVRHALAVLAEAGTVHARRGAGVFVTARPTEYQIGRRVRFRQNIEAAGRVPSRRITRVETLPGAAAEVEALGLPPGALVHVVEGVSLADGQPLAAFRSVFPADRLAGFAALVTAAGSITEALAAAGVPDYTRATTRITATTAPAMLALTLQVPEGAPVLRTRAVNLDGQGQPIEFGTTWFAGDRVTLTVAPD